MSLIHISLECTNFSQAKGGQPRDADSRTLAEHLFRYIEAINPDYIQIENVEEFIYQPTNELFPPVYNLYLIQKEDRLIGESPVSYTHLFQMHSVSLIRVWVLLKA